jgi:hypothetical protein
MQLLLPLEGDTAVGKGDFHGLLVKGLNEPWSESLVQINSRRQDLPRQFLKLVPHFCPVGFRPFVFS